MSPSKGILENLYDGAVDSYSEYSYKCYFFVVFSNMLHYKKSNCSILMRKRILTKEKSIFGRSGSVVLTKVPFSTF